MGTVSGRPHRSFPVPAPSLYLLSIPRIRTLIANDFTTHSLFLSVLHLRRYRRPPIEPNPPPPHVSPNTLRNPGPSWRLPPSNASLDPALNSAPLHTPARRFPRLLALHHIILVDCRRLPPRPPSLLLRTRALARNNTLSLSLVVRLDTFHHVGRDVLENLSDPTGSLATSIHASVLETLGPDLRVGAVLVLANVRAVTHHSKTSTGFRTDPSSQVHLILSNASTIARIFDSRVNDAEGDGEGRVLPARLEPLSPQSILDAYAAAARSPKAVVRTRKRPGPSPIRQPQVSARQKCPQYQPQL